MHAGVSCKDEIVLRRRVLNNCFVRHGRKEVSSYVLLERSVLRALQSGLLIGFIRWGMIGIAVGLCTPDDLEVGLHSIESRTQHNEFRCFVVHGCSLSFLSFARVLDKCARARHAVGI
jgi:hypothetical protein